MMLSLAVNVLIPPVSIYLGQIQVGAHPRRGGDAGGLQNVQDDGTGQFPGGHLVGIQIVGDVHEHLVDGVPQLPDGTDHWPPHFYCRLAKERCRFPVIHRGQVGRGGESLLTFGLSHWLLLEFSFAMQLWEIN